jgi:hypothetical protein
VQPITEADLNTHVVKEELRNFNDKVAEELSSDPSNTENLDLPDYLQYIEGDEDTEDNVTPQYDHAEPEAAMPETDDYSPEDFDKYISAEVLLLKGDNLVLGKVIKRKRDDEDDPIVIAHNNPIFDTCFYQVKFPKGQVEEYSANVIAQNLYSQLDSEGHRFVLLDEIVDFMKDKDAVHSEDLFVISSNGNIHKRRTTKGWHLCILWKDRSTSWKGLKDVKESFPIHVAEFAISRGLEKEPAFAWWVRDTLLRKNHIVKAMKTRYACKTHKYGIRLPKSTKEA